MYTRIIRADMRTVPGRDREATAGTETLPTSGKGQQLTFVRSIPAASNIVYLQRHQLVMVSEGQKSSAEIIPLATSPPLTPPEEGETIQMWESKTLTCATEIVWEGERRRRWERYNFSACFLALADHG